LQIGDRLIAGFFRFVQFLAHSVKLGDIVGRHAGKAVQQPVGKPSKAEGDE